MMLLAAAGPAGADELPDAVRRAGLRWPGEAGKRITVRMGVSVVDFARLNLREESFDMAGYLDLAWTDLALALRPGDPPKAVRRFRPAEVWRPALEFANAVEQVVGEREGDVYAGADGACSQRVRFAHKFSSLFDLRRFPFDRQTLVVVIVPFDPMANDLDLVVDESRVRRLPAASLSDWDIGAVGARPADTPGGGREVRFEVNISRRSTYYIWRVLLPMTLLVVASWTVFWFEVHNLQPQISTGLAILLSTVTFNFAIDFSLPKVAYLLFLDRYLLTSFGFVLLAVFAVAALHAVLRRSGPERAARLQSAARWVFPAGYVLVLLVVVPGSLL